MTFYYDFEGRRMHAELSWPRNGDTIRVQLTDKRLTKDFPGDLLFDVKAGNKIDYIIENRDNKRLTELQHVICKRLRELAK